MKSEFMEINRRENWGCLERPDDHIAAVGARLADNRSRHFGVFADRITAIGDRKIATLLNRWLVSRKTLNEIRKNTRFVFGGDACVFEKDAVIGRRGDIKVHLKAICRGEYCHLAAYADRIECMGAS